MSTINWNLTKYIFLDGIDGIIKGNKSIKCYCDREINGKVSNESFQHIIPKIMEFIPTKEGIHNKTIKTEMGKSDAICKWYENSKYRLELWYDKEGYGMIFGAFELPDRYAICSNYAGHPTVMTKDFLFCNSDGSTLIDIDISSLLIEELKKYLCDKTVEYVLDQHH